jgi:tRNA G46 methylase TrmB
MFSRLISFGFFLLVLTVSASTAFSQHGSQHDDDATMHHGFSDAQKWADHFEDPARDSWQLPDQVVSTLAVRSDLIVADIGSATGYFPVRFARACPEGRVFGLDIENEMVWFLNERARRDELSNLVSLLAAQRLPPH